MIIKFTGNSRQEAVDVALAQHFNKPDTCQLTVRLWLDSPSVGDVDGDGSADAEDGWKSEPFRFRHSDRNPPEGVPVTYLGGSHDNGHRALSLGGGMIRSTDAGGTGKVATVPLAWPEQNFGVHYVGWSETMDGLMIPTSRGERVDKAVTLIRRAMKDAHTGSERMQDLRIALNALLRIPKA